MTRVLYWNIKDFGLNKIDHQEPAAFVHGHGGLNNQNASLQRRQAILNLLQQTNPDIFVLVEVCTGRALPGALIAETTGALGCRTLLRLMRTQHPDWRLVPPLILGHGGPKEGIAVFFRSPANERYFSGPKVWLGAAAGDDVPAPGMFPGVVYPPFWSAALSPPRPPPPAAPLPARGLVPPGSAHNPGRPEDMLAGRVLDLGFPPVVAAQWLNFRQPYLCTFWEPGAGAGGVGRNLSIFAVHAPPDRTAVNFLQYAAAAVNGLAAPLANETRVVLGDFNINLLNPADGADAHAYAPFTALNYVPLVNPQPLPGGANLASYLGYATTHMKGAPVFLSTGALAQFYPGFGYSGSDIGNFFSIDNILVQPRVAARDYHTTVVNTVVGTPYLTLGGFVAGSVPNTTGGGNTPIAIPSYFGDPPAPFPWAVAGGNGQAPGADRGLENRLTKWDNYGRIYDTSDHFAVFADV
ncbi:MAG TPA: endonuclease/exonuclease/phosphatase family protein [Allosphingosinicella sp.]|jgi:hypothetical protein